MLFKDKLYVEYPIPKEVTIWGGNGLNTSELVSIDELIRTSTEELRSDILITAYTTSRGMKTKMPDDTVTVSSAMLTSNYMFQGNRLVKVTYDKCNNVAFTNYYPCSITYKRFLRVEDLETLVGDQLRYVKAYIFAKMAEKELTVLKAVNMTVENGAIDFQSLQEFKSNMLNLYNELKPEILMYSTVY